MKFPLDGCPYGRDLPMRHEDAGAEYARELARLLHEATRAYERLDRAALKQQLKTVKSRENLIVYRDRREPPPELAWGLPQLVAVGTFVGTLEDVMYGIVAPSVEAMRTRSLYMQDDVVDSAVLEVFVEPAIASPFQFLGIKWLVTAPATTASSTSLTSMLKPRDALVLEGTGLYTLASGETVGYQVLHSIDHPRYAPLDGLGLPRQRVSSVALYKQLGNGTVDVYWTKYIESTGRMTDSVATGAVAGNMMACWKSVWCAQNRKLAWMMFDAASKWDEEERGEQRVVATTNRSGGYCCGICSKDYKLYHTVTTCKVCYLMVCSKCQITRNLGSHNTKSGDFGQVRTVFCKNCVSLSTKECSMPMARREWVLEDPHEPTATPDDSSSAHHKLGHMRGSTALTVSTTRGSVLDLGSFEAVESVSQRGYDTDSYEIQTVDEWEQENDSSFYLPPPVPVFEDTPSPVSTASYGRMDPQQQLWLQMNQLCKAAEQTYRITKQNAVAIQQHDMGLD